MQGMAALFGGMAAAGSWAFEGAKKAYHKVAARVPYFTHVKPTPIPPSLGKCDGGFVVAKMTYPAESHRVNLADDAEVEAETSRVD